MKRSIHILGLIFLNSLFFISYIAGKAQSATVTGVVYENDQSKITFETPKGKKTLYLPDDIRPGDMISGRVVDEPAGTNEKQKTKNLAELLKYKLVLPDGKLLQTVPATNPVINDNGQVTYNTTPFNVGTLPGSNLFSVELQDPDNTMISKADILTLPQIPVTPGTNSVCIVSKKIISNTEPLVLVQTNIANNNNITQVELHDYFSTNSSGKPGRSYSLQPATSSAHKSVFELPAGISGMFTVCVQYSNGKSKLIDLVNIVDIMASIGKGSLLKGEITQLNVQVTGLEGCPFRPVQLEISNKSTSIIHLQNGDQQLFPVDQYDAPIALIQNTPYSTIQNVIGQSIGNFTIENTLHAPASAYANPIQPYLEEIKSPEQFNQSMDALKKDIDSYFKNVQKIAAAKENNDYLFQVKNLLPNVSNINELAKAKSQVSNMLSPLSMNIGGRPYTRYLNELNNLHPDVVSQSEIPQLVHPLHDLAGEFDAATNILTVREENKEALLQYLGATISADGSYSFQLPGNNNNPVTYHHILTKDPNEPYGGGCYGPGEYPPSPTPGDEPGTKAQTGDTPPPKAGDVDSLKPGEGAQVGDIPKPGETPKDTTKKEEESGLGKLNNVYTDSSGRSYRFYKDAICQELVGPFKTECAPQTERTWDPKTKEPIDTPTGNYDRWDHLGMRVCVKGTGFCTEMNQIKAVQMIFEDKDCKRMIKVVNWDGYMCP